MALTKVHDIMSKKKIDAKKPVNSIPSLIQLFF